MVSHAITLESIFIVQTSLCNPYMIVFVSNYNNIFSWWYLQNKDRKQKTEDLI